MEIQLCDEGFYIDLDELDDDGLHPEVMMPEDLNVVLAAKDVEIAEAKAHVFNLTDPGPKLMDTLDEQLRALSTAIGAKDARVAELESHLCEAKRQQKFNEKEADAAEGRLRAVVRGLIDNTGWFVSSKIDELMSVAGLVRCECGGSFRVIEDGYPEDCPCTLTAHPGWVEKE